MEIKRSEDKQVSKNFKASEFYCKCGKCGTQVITKDLIIKLQELRDVIGEPIYINSAYRCPTHNKVVGGASDSQHLKGKAADIRVDDLPPWVVMQAAEQIGFTGIHAYSTFTHVDVRPKRARW